MGVKQLCIRGMQTECRGQVGGGVGGVYRERKKKRKTVRKETVSENKERTKDGGGVVTK